MFVNQPTNTNFTSTKKDDAEIVSLESLLSSSDSDDDNNDNSNQVIKDKGDTLILPINGNEEEENEEDKDDAEIKVNSVATPPNTDIIEDNPVIEKVEYKTMIKKLWGDDIEMLSEVNENGEEIEVLLDDANIDEETFVNIVKSKLAEIEDKYKSRLDTSNVSEFTKHLINIESNGGSVKAAIELYQTYKDPLASLDMDKEQDQIDAIVMRHQAVGTEESVIADLIDTYKTKGILKDKGLKAKEELDQAVDAKIKALDEQAKEAKIKHENDLKAYAKDLKTVLSNFNIKDSLKSKIVEASTKKEANGQYLLESLYNSARVKPETAAELALYLVDRESFIKTLTEKAVIKEKTDTLKKLRLIPTKEKTGQHNSRNTDSESISLTELLNK